MADKNTVYMSEKQKVKEITDKLEAGLKELFESEKYKSYGVWPDYNSDLAFRNTVVVLPFEDGTFRYLSNSIEQIELELPPIARKKG